MEDTLKVREVHDSVDGDYKFDLIGMLALHGPSPEALTHGELHRIKKMTGLRAGELMDGLEAGDTDVMVAFAAIVLQRNDKTFEDSLLWDAPASGAIEIEIGEREEPESPPESGPGTEIVGSPVRPDPPDDKRTSSGGGTEDAWGSQAIGQERIGHPA